MKDDREETEKPTGKRATSADDKSEQEGSWKYSSGTQPESSSNIKDDSLLDISWSASEFIAHKKDVGWYVILALITLAIAAVTYILTHDKMSTAVIVLAGGIFGFYAARKPRLLNYKIDRSGVTIQTKLFGYDTFKSFAVIEDSALPNIVLLPLKRFMPRLSIYLDPSSEGKVIKALTERIPQDSYQQDIIERLMQRVRF
jgi:hypothetical protein